MIDAVELDISSPAVKDIDIAVVTTETSRTSRVVAQYAPLLWRWRTHIRLEDELAPHDAGLARAELLARAKVVLMLQAGEHAPRFEHALAEEATRAGCALVSEHAPAHQPFEPGTHYLSASADNLALVAQELLEDPERASALVAAARTLLERP